VPEYTYRHNTTGEERSIFQAMSEAHPEAVTVAPDGSWTPAVMNDPLAFNRVYSSRTIPNETRHKYPYVSRVLPKGLDGGKTDRYGSTVVLSPKHEREICAKHGYVRD